MMTPSSSCSRAKRGEVWVLADNDDAVAFYRACGFDIADGQATYMTRNHPGPRGV